MKAYNFEKFATLCGLSVPIVQSGMGGVAGPRLAAAVSNAGALGSVGLYRHEPHEIHMLIDLAQSMTDKAIAVNFVPMVLSERDLSARVAAIGERGKPPIITFFGLPSQAILDFCFEFTEVGVQVGSLEDAQRAIDAGAHFVVLQTIDAGGHHLGTLDRNDSRDTLQSLKNPDDIPILRAGGIATGADLLQVLTDGFSGALCGTVFAATHESFAHPIYKSKILSSNADDTEITDAFSIGWHTHKHRVIRNRTCDKTLPSTTIGVATYFGRDFAIPRYSVAVPTESTKGAIEEMALYAGVACRNITQLKEAGAIIAAFRETLNCSDIQRTFTR